MSKPLIDAENGSKPHTFDPDKVYRYTWPGQKPVEVNGSELTALCRGADPSQLAIEEVIPPAPAVPRPEAPAPEPAPEPVSEPPASDVVVTPDIFHKRPSK